MQVSYRRDQHKASRAVSTVLSQPCPWGAEIMGGNLGKWPGGGACLGMWPCLRRNTGQNPAFSVSPWGVDNTLYFLTPQKPNTGNPVLGLPTTSAP